MGASSHLRPVFESRLLVVLFTVSRCCPSCSCQRWGQHENGGIAYHGRSLRVLMDCRVKLEARLPQCVSPAKHILQFAAVHLLR